MKFLEETADLLNSIGKRIQAIRQGKSLSLSRLAQKTGFTKSYLSQIENSKREPPISTLAKIAYVLGTDVTFLITGEPKKPKTSGLTILRKGEARDSYSQFGENGYRYQPLLPERLDRLMDPFIISVGPEFPPEPLSHEGQEFVYVIEGTQEFIYDGQTYYFDQGDCFFFDSKKSHYSRTVGEKPGKVLVVFATQELYLPQGLLSRHF